MPTNRMPGRVPEQRSHEIAALPVSTPERRLGRAVVPRVRRSAPPVSPPEETVDLGSYWKIVRGRWRVVVGVFCLVVAAVAVGTHLQEPVYRATGIIEIRRADEGLPAAASSQGQRITDQYLETEYEILRSPALAQRVVDDLAAAAPAMLASRVSAGSDGFVPGAAEEAGAEIPRHAPTLQEHLKIEPVRGSRLVRIHFDSGDPRVAASVVNSTIRRYTDMRVDAALAAEAQLATQVDSVRTQLALAEGRLQDYVRGSELLFVETRGESENIVHERLRRLQQELTEAEADRYAKESVHNLVRQQGVESLGSDVLRSLSTRIAELRIEYARLRSTFTDEFPRTRQVKEQLDEMERLLARERQRIAREIARDYAAAVQRQELLLGAFEEQRSRIDQLAGSTAEYHAQKREVESQQALFGLLQQKQKEASVSAALAYTEVGIVNPATVPDHPIRPDPRRNLKLASLLGIILGLGAAFLREYTDGTVRTVEEVDAISDRPVLALIPSSDSIDEEHRGPAMAEAFGVLRTAILLNAGPPEPRTLLITSAQPQEGKTTVSTSLAASLATLGHRVLLIDADTRRPAVHTTLHLKPSGGLVDYLSGTAGWRTLVQPSRAPGLDVLPSGYPPPNSAELLASIRMRELMEAANLEYDFVVVDSPAVFINAADTRILAPLVDGVVLVVRSGVTPRDITARVLRLVPNVVGLVLNGVNFRHFPAYYGQYTAVRNGDGTPKRLSHGART